MDSIISFYKKIIYLFIIIISIMVIYFFNGNINKKGRITN